MRKKRLLIVIAAVSLGGVLLGWLIGNAYVSFLSCVLGLCGGGFALGYLRAVAGKPAPTADFREQVAAAVAERRDPANTTALVEDMLSDGRYALLLRPQILPNLTASQQQRAAAELKERMASIAAGEVLLGVAGTDSDDAPEMADPLDVGTQVAVDDYHIDRRAVTNRQYRQFVAGGGYQQMALWEPQIWPAVLNFVDQTGKPGPRFWKNGAYESGQDDVPVVGVSWYEAAAYARWVGKRLPTDAEWEKAGSVPVQLSESSCLQRRYPWGDHMLRTRANIWGCGPGTPVAVDGFAEGATGTDVRQLIGNVWEWTADDFGPQHLLLPAPMKSIRGGAFDTYFETHATCQFGSGEVPVSRRHNVGFRCALSDCDLHERERAAPATNADSTERDDATTALCEAASA